MNAGALRRYRRRAAVPACRFTPRPRRPNRAGAAGAGQDASAWGRPTCASPAPSPSAARGGNHDESALAPDAYRGDQGFLCLETLTRSAATWPGVDGGHRHQRTAFAPLRLCLRERYHFGAAGKARAAATVVQMSWLRLRALGAAPERLARYRMRGHSARMVFAKAPTPGRVKTRRFRLASGRSGIAQ